jgi:hypothetical protein
MPLQTLAAYPAFNASNQPLGDAWDNGTGGIDICGNHEGAGGTFNFWGLIANGFLTKEGTPAHGIYERYDTCSQTVNMISHPEEGVLIPSLLQSYVYNETSQVMISFDNVQSFAAKGEAGDHIRYVLFRTYSDLNSQSHPNDPRWFMSRYRILNMICTLSITRGIEVRPRGSV